MMGLLLLIVAIILLWIVSIPALIIGILISLKNRSANKYFKSLAISIDQFGNVLCQHLFNAILISEFGYKFGDVDETISEVLAKNYRSNNLTKAGYFLSFKILNKIDRGHIS